MTSSASDPARPTRQHLLSTRAPIAAHIRPTTADETRDLAQLLAATAVGLALGHTDDAPRILSEIADGDPTAVRQARTLVAAFPCVDTEDRCAAASLLAGVPGVPVQGGTSSGGGSPDVQR